MNHISSLNCLQVGPLTTKMAVELAEVKGGYEYTFVKEPPHGLKCVICLAIVRQPQQHGECGKLFCMSCLTQHRQMSSKCPNCALQLNTFYDGKSDSEVKTLKVKCDYSDNGCQWVGELGSIHKHTRSCEHATVTCPNHCERVDPTIKLLHKDLIEHLETCLNRSHLCPHCNSMGPHSEITTSHLEICPKIEVQCPFPECTITIPRCYLDTHTTTCPNKTSACKFLKLGCPAMLSQAEMVAHDQDDQLHLQLVKEKVLELTDQLQEREQQYKAQIDRNAKQIATLKHSVSALAQHKGPATFQFTGFDTHKHSDLVFWSKPFYLENSYRFVVAIHANGYGSAKNTHISLFLWLVQGEKDNSLTWPFLGAIRVDLLNQLEDKQHISTIVDYKTLSYGKDFKGGERPAGKLYGWVKEYFVSIKQLSNVSSRRQYIKKDKIYFRVSSCV